MTEKPSLRENEHAGELLRFLVVGLSAVGTDFLVYFAILKVSPAASPSVAKAVSFVAGAVVSFLANRGFVFRTDARASRQIGPFALLYLVSLGLNNAMNAAVLALTSMKLLAWLFATGTSTVSNFVGMKFVVFKRAPKNLEGAEIP